MSKFEIEVGALITIQEGDSFIIEAENLEKAKCEARRLLKEKINEKYAWCDYDDGDFDIGFTNQLD